MNKVMLMGRLVVDPELRMGQSGVSVANFRIAVDRRFQKAGEEKQSDFFTIVCFKHTAEFVKKYFVKGQLVLISGSLQTRSWDGQDGKKNYVTEVIADDVYFTGDRREQGSQPAQQSNWQKPSNEGYVPDRPADDGFMTVEDDQLPF